MTTLNVGGGEQMLIHFAFGDQKGGSACIKMNLQLHVPRKIRC